MKTFTKFFFIFTVIFLALGVTTLQSQITIQGLVSENEGSAAWNADGSGPEPFGDGHSTFLYYVASRDYVDPNSAYGAHVTGIGADFPAFTLALNDDGFTPEQVKFRIGLSSLGDDLEGSDWFLFGQENFLNFYPMSISIYLNDELMITGVANYMIFYYGPSTGWFWETESNFFRPVNASELSSQAVQNVAAAFMQDLGEMEIRANLNTVGTSQDFSGNGRSGAYFSYYGSLEKGLPEIPLLGLHADNEGGAGCDADGTGTEPYGNGHGNFLYYTASVDYDDINPSPDAALCHLLDVEKGFQNTILQLQYRGYEIGDIKIKMGLASLGPDVEGEDWGTENGHPWLNDYNNLFTFELIGEPILQMLCDTNKLVAYTNYWVSHSSIGKLYDISQNAFADAQFVAYSLIKDIGNHYLEMNTGQMSPAGNLSGNGRNGGFYEINDGSLVALHEKATFLQEGALAGNLTLEGSPYYVEGHQFIENGQTLTIEPGVRIGVRGPYHFNMQGCLKAEGTPDHIITFTSSNPNLRWDGIDFDETPVENDSSLFNHCIFQYGLAQGTAAKWNSGGALAIGDVDKIEIRNSIFRHNKANLPGSYPPCGGAISFENSDLLVQKCIFYDNFAEYGGAIFAYNQSNPVISNNLIYENTAAIGGACSFYEDCNGILINNTIVDNIGNNGGAFYFYHLSEPEIINNIIWGNSAATGAVASFSQSSNVGFFYNDIEGGQLGFIGNFTGGYLFNVEDDPMFETAPGFPLYHPSGESPCINAGSCDTSAWFYPQYLPATCLCGNPRILNDRIEIGAYELLIDGIDHPGTENGVFEMTSYPNPFTESTTIEFALTEDAMVTIFICNHLGQLVTTLLNERLTGGMHQAAWNAGNLPEGVYFVKVQNARMVAIEMIIKY